MEALVFKKFKTRDNQVASNFRFRQQLLNGLTCDGFAEKQFGQLTYGERSLVGLFEEYNKCKNAAYTVYDASRKREAFHLAIRPRVSYSSAKATLTTYQIGFETSFDPQLQYGIGVNLEYVLPFNRNKWAFMMEPVLNQPYKQKVPINNIHLRGRDLFLEMNYAPIDLFLGIRYYIFLNDNTRLFLNVGYVKGFKRKSRMEYTGEGTAIGYSTAWIGTTLQNLDVGAGVKFARRFSLEARYNTVRSANGGLLYWDIPYKSASFVLGVDVF